MSNLIIANTAATKALEQLLREKFPQLGPAAALSALTLHDVITLLAPMPAAKKNKRLPLPQNQSTIEYISLAEISHIKADRQYCVFHLIGKRSITVSRHIGIYEKILGGHPFFRVHRSHIVNLEQVCRFHRQDDALEMLDGSRVAVARNLREKVLAQLAG